MIPILNLAPEIAEIREELNQAIAHVIDETAFIMGPQVKAFEDHVAAYLNVKHAIGVNSGTDALVLALRALGIGEGDEVITTPFSFFATAESISTVGATPVFVDIDERTYNIDSRLIESAITPKTKAIMPVHLYGNPCAMGQIMHLAQRYGLRVVEDCAQSFGARYMGHCAGCLEEHCPSHVQESLRGKHTGTIGDIGAYSFFPSKNLGAFGDGGLIVTNDDQLADSMRMLRVHGARKKYHNEVLGYNTRLDTLQAALLDVKLPHIDRWNEGRRQAAMRYNALFSGVDEVVTPVITDGYVFHQYTIRFKSFNRDAMSKALADVGIGTMVYYPIPQDKLPVYAHAYTPQPISARVADQVLSLPIWPSISEETQKQVVDAILSILKR